MVRAFRARGREQCAVRACLAAQSVSPVLPETCNAGSITDLTSSQELMQPIYLENTLVFLRADRE